MERLALRYNDGSINVLVEGTDIAGAERNRSMDDDSVAPDIVRVNIDVIETVAAWKPKQKP